MIDRQTLELAAKAAGIEVWSGSGFQIDMLFCNPLHPDTSGKVTGIRWNPNTDHGQLLDLAIACGISIMHDDIGYTVEGCLRQFKRYTHGNFTSLAETVILAAADQQRAKEGS